MTTLFSTCVDITEKAIKQQTITAAKMENTWILYQTTNNVNGRIYIGVHKVTDTWYSRKYLGSGSTLKLAIKKHGEGNFTRVTLNQFSCVEEAYSAEAEMVTEEFIKRLDTYNIRTGGRGGIGIKHTAESKAKMSAFQKGKKVSEETKTKISNAKKGRILTEDHKAKLSAANKGRTHTAEARNKMKGRVHTEEEKAKMSAARKGKTLTEEHRAKISVALRRKPHNEDTRTTPPKAGSRKGKPVMIGEAYYDSVILAAIAKNVCSQTILDRIKSKFFEDYCYATKKEDEIISGSV
jgi:group I intron endonuclease